MRNQYDELFLHKES